MTMGKDDDGLSAFLRARPRLFPLRFGCWAAQPRPRTSSRTSGFGGRPLTGTRCAIRWRSSLPRPRDSRSTCSTPLAREERPVQGSWLPEPVDTTTDPGLWAERGEALNSAVLLLLEKLLPTERAAYVLREAFNYPYREIAAVLRVEEANARQLVTRAREHVSGGRRAPVSPAEQRRLLNAFVTAARTGDLARLESLFASDLLAVPPPSRLSQVRTSLGHSGYTHGNIESDHHGKGHRS